MATNFKLKRSSVASKRPGLSNLELGELALNTYDGFLFTERNGLGITTVTNLTPWYENYGAGSIFYINKVGIGTTAVPDTNQLLIKGGTETDNINVTGITTVGSLTSGRVVTVGTGGKLQDSSNLTFDGTNLFVSGINITGGSTVGADIVTRNLKVTGISTHIGISTFNDAEFYDNVTFFGTNPNASSNKILFNKSANLLRFFDNAKADFGQSGDLQIYHLGGINYIDCTTSAQLLLQSDDLHIRNAAGNQEIITTAVNGDVQLFYSGNQKLATTVGGINVTGTTDTDNFINAGVSTFVGIITASATQNIIPFLYSAFGDLPSATSYHGAFAHVHARGKGYFAHAANWYELVNKELDGTIGVGTEQVRVGVTTVTTFNATGNVTLGDADTDNIVFNGDINSNIIPNTNNTYELGSATKRWKTLYTGATTKIDSDIVTRNLSVTGLGTFANDVTFTGASYNAVWDQSDSALEFADNAKATFGNTQDLEIYHDSNSSYVLNKTGNLHLLANSLLLKNRNNNESYIRCFQDAQVELYYDNTKRLATSGVGVTVYNQLDTTNINASGIITAVDGNFTGNVSIAGTLTYQDVTNVDSVGIATARVGLRVLSGGIDAVGVITATGGLDAIGIQSGGVNITTGIITAINFTGTGNTVTYDSSTKIVSVSVGGAGGGTGGKFVANNTGIHTLSNVGIGTTNASDKLKVLGDVAFTGALKVSPLGLSGSNGNYLKSVGTGVTWASFPTARTVGLQTATANQTSFSFAYNVGFLDVYINGVKLTTNEFTATNGTSVVLTEGAFLGDQVQLISFNTTATGGGGGGGITDVVQDATPQLGGNLDLNSKVINGSGNIDYTGNFKASGIATATTFSGSGASLTNLNASTLASGTVPSARLAGPYTNVVAGSATVAANVTVFANNTNNETCYPLFADGATGTQNCESDTGLTYNPSTGNLTATKFTGDGSALTGISGSGGVTVQDEGSALSTTGTTLNFVGSGVVASGNGAVKTITIAGGGSGNAAGFSTSGGNFTVNAGVTTVIDTFNINTNTKLSEYTVHLENVNGNIQSQKVLVMNYGAGIGLTAYSSEYGIMFHPNQIADIGVVVTAGICSLTATTKSGITGITTFSLTRQDQS